jgi:haloalkane dehalogenase
VLVVHDWGGLIGLRWACDHPDAVRALVISATGFFADGKWHGMAEAMRAPETGEQLMGALDRGGFGDLLRGSSAAFTDRSLDEYFKGLADDARRRGALELYRSGDFDKLAPYDLSGLGVPALLVWGAADQFAPVASAQRFERELPETELVVLDGAGHFVFEDEPEACAEAVTGFLARIDTWSGSST